MLVTQSPTTTMFETCRSNCSMVFSFCPNSSLTAFGSSINSSIFISNNLLQFLRASVVFSVFFPFHCLGGLPLFCTGPEAVLTAGWDESPDECASR